MRLVVNSLSRKFLLPTLALSMLLFSGLGLLLAKNSDSSLRAVMDAKGNAVADFIGSLGTDYFSIYDFQDFENFVRALKTDTDLEFAAFYNDRMEPLSDVSNVPADVSDLMIYEHGITDTAGNVMGHFKLGYNKQSLSNNLRASIRIIAFVTLLALLLLAVGITILVRQLIIHRVRATVDMLEDIAQGDGDLTKRLEAGGGDELGELAKWFNTFVDNIQKVIVVVRQGVEQVSSSSSELSATAANLNRGSEEQKSQIEQIASAALEMAQNIGEVARNAHASNQASREASEFAAQGKEAVGSTVGHVNRIAEIVTTASQAIEQLGTSANEIGEMVGVIDEIADKTNLLALNAAIEAARAGEKGRGFAVVADEVRKLAENTTRATSNIAAMIKKIQNESETSVRMMANGNEAVETGVRLAEDALSALGRIVDASTQAATQAQMISASTEEQSATTEQVSENMENILGVTHETTGSTTQVTEASRELERLAGALQNSVGLFKV